jgi:hypothetical protein
MSDVREDLQNLWENCVVTSYEDKHNLKDIRMTIALDDGRELSLPIVGDSLCPKNEFHILIEGHYMGCWGMK